METREDQVEHYHPDVNIEESENELILRADLPGTTSDDISVNFDDGYITLEAKVPPRDLGGKPLRREYGIANFYRRFEIREAVDTESATADYSDGVLTVRLPKLRSKQAKRIAVH